MNKKANREFQSEHQIHTIKHIDTKTRISDSSTDEKWCLKNNKKDVKSKRRDGVFILANPSLIGRRFSQFHLSPRISEQLNRVNRRAD